VEVAYAEAKAIRPERKINSAIDLEAWAVDQNSLDQLIPEKKMEGYSLEQIACDLDLPVRKVFDRAKKLSRSRGRSKAPSLPGRVCPIIGT
jgi:hypothetical protein